MTISTTSSSVILLGNNSDTSFQFPFVGVSANDIEVIYSDTSGVQTVLSPSQYNISLNAPSPGQLWGIGGSVEYPTAGSPIANGTSITIQRILSYTQLTTISNQGSFAPQVIETALDTLCMELQQVASRTGQLRGTWQTGVEYNFGDIVLDGVNGADTGNYYTCIIANTSGVWATDLAAGDWALGIDVQIIEQYAAAAAASAAQADADVILTNADVILTNADVVLTHADVILTNADVVLTHADVVLTHADVVTANAAAAAAADYAASYSGTSTSSVAIGTGTKNFTTQSNKLWVNGQFLQISSNAGATNYMHATVSSYSGTSLVVNVTDIGGTGTFADWNISISGTRGPTGSGSGTVNSGTSGQMAYYGSTSDAVSGSTGIYQGASGQLILGHTSSLVTVGQAQLQVDTTNQVSATYSRFSNDSNSPNLMFTKSRAASIGTNTIVQSGDVIGDIVFYCANGTSYTAAAEIRISVDGTPGTVTDMPGRIGFYTTPDGSGTPIERVRIDNQGNMGIGATANAQVIVDVVSTTEQSRPLPSMTTTQVNALAAVEAGMAYDTTLHVPKYYNGSAWVATTSPKGQQVITSGASNFTAPANGTANTVYKFTLTGSGAGGAGGVDGAGAGAGTTAIYYATGLTPSSTHAYTIGAGGTGGTAGNNGSAGNSSTVNVAGTTITAPGGGAPTFGINKNGGAGGAAATNAFISIRGGGGGSPAQQGNAEFSGQGGASFWGGGGQGVGATEGTLGIAGGAYGSGGSGATTSATGGAGASGILLVEWY